MGLGKALFELLSSTDLKAKVKGSLDEEWFFKAAGQERETEYLLFIVIYLRT